MKKEKKNHVKIGDKIKIMSGSQRGFIGKIYQIFKSESLALIEGLTPRMKYIKSSEEGKTNTREIPQKVHISNLMLWDEKAQQTSRIGYKFLETSTKKGKKIKVRYFKKSGNVLENK